MELPTCVAGIFVGGRSSRMSGIPKGLLQPPRSADGLVTRLAQQLSLAGLSDVVQVGEHEAYAHLGLPVVADAAEGCGPMAGLLGLVKHAKLRGNEFVLALACDMPAVDAQLLARLCTESLEADALVPKRQYWEPLCARYRARAVLPHLQALVGSGRLRMLDLLDVLGDSCVELALGTAEARALEDWDSPSDLPEGVVYQSAPLGRSGKVT